MSRRHILFRQQMGGLDPPSLPHVCSVPVMQGDGAGSHPRHLSAHADWLRL